MSEQVRGTGRRALRPTDLQAIVKRIKTGQMPRCDTRLGKLLRDVEDGLFNDLGDNATTANTVKISLVLQLLVLIAGLPLFNKGKSDVHGSYKWAVEQLRELLNELGKPTGSTKKPAIDGVTLGDIISAETE